MKTILIVGFGIVGKYTLKHIFDSMIQNNTDPKNYKIIVYDINPNAFKEDPNNILEMSKYDIYLENVIFEINPKNLEVFDYIIICLPTYTNNDRDSIDLQIFDNLFQMINDMNLKHENSVLINRSTVRIGDTQSFAKKYNYRYCINVPERYSPGNNIYQPLIAGGDKSIIQELNSTFFEIEYNSENPKITEAVKLFENHYRFLMISGMNEMFLMSKELGLNFSEIYRLLQTKETEMDHYLKPGLIGGQCIGIDDVYLLDSLKEKTLPETIYRTNLEYLYTLENDIFDIIMEKISTYFQENPEEKILFYGLSYKSNSFGLDYSIPYELYQKLNDIFPNKIIPYEPFAPVDSEFKNISEKNSDITSVLIIVDHDYAETFRENENYTVLFDIKEYFRGNYNVSVINDE